MADVGGRARDGVEARARAGLAQVGLAARVTVIAGRVVHLQAGKAAALVTRWWYESCHRSFSHEVAVLVMSSQL